MPVKEKIKFRIYSFLTVISPVLSTKVQYRIQNGRPLNLDEPQSFSEKLSWLKLYVYASDPLVKQCADKFAVREYVSKCGFGKMLNELYGVFDNVEDVPWDELPKRYVLKWNFGCGFNILNDGKASFDTAAAKKQLAVWKKIKFWNYHAELQYKGIKPCILCERFLDSPDDEDLIDYKFYTFSGKVLAILVIARKHGEPECAAFMTPDWKYLSDIPNRYRSTFHPSMPRSLEGMINAAERLAKPFPFVRVDFYEHDGSPVFGELTFTPAAGINPAECPVDGKDMGSFIDIMKV